MSMESRGQRACPGGRCTCGADALDDRPAETGRGIDRRTFVLRAALAGAAAALAACASGADSVTAPGSVSLTLRVSDYGALGATGGVALVSAGGSPLAVVRTGDASFVALSRVCPHQGAIVNVSGSGFLCPGHGARFALDGTWTGGERTRSLYSYPTSYDAETGILTVG